MASILSAGTTSATAMVHTADTSGVLQLASNNGTVALTIDTSQNIGIGTTSPNYKLDAVGYMASRGAIGSNYFGYLLWDSTSSGIAGALQWNPAGSLQLGTNKNYPLDFYTNNGSVAMRIDTTGFVGIGTTSVSMPLRVASAQNSNWIAAFDNSGTNPYGVRIDTSANSGSAYSLAIYTNAGTGMYVFNSGKVAVGTNNPSAYFGSSFVVARSGNDVVGLIDTSGSAGNTVQTIKAGANGSDTTTVYTVFQRSDGTSRGNIIATGTNGVVYNTTSDYRLKTVVGPVSGSGERIDALEPVEYIWNEDGSTERGFLAHKFKEVYSRSVSGEKDEVDADGKPKYQSMQASSSEVIADLVSEIQSLRARLKAANIA